MMTSKVGLLGGVASVALIVAGFASASQAETAKVAPKHKKVMHHAAAKPESELSVLKAELAAQAAHMAELQAQLNAQQTAVQQAQAQAASVETALQTAEAQNADATAAVLASIPTQISSAVQAAKPKTDAIYYKGVKITLGGFAEADSIYRSRNTANDLSTSWNSIPFANSPTGHEDQLTFTGRQSRITGLVEGQVNPNIKLSYYGELDFQGAAQSANLNQSDSFNPRIREMYGTVDFADTGWHFLAGQNWSLATMNSKGITPRNEVQPSTIDSAYLPGYVYLRQPQFRITKDFMDHKLWVAVSVEEAQTIESGSVPSGTFYAITNGSGYYGGQSGSSAPTSAGGSALTIAPTETCTTSGATVATLVVKCVSTATTESGVPTTATQSLNHMPDLIAKVAYELPIYGRTVHLEAFGLGRAFTAATLAGLEQNKYSGGVGGGILAPIVPGKLDIHASFLTGTGVGRYETSQLPDVTFNQAGVIKPIQETDFMIGATFHATPMLDIYSYAGAAHENRTSYNNGSSVYGYGYNTATSLAGCFTENGSCSAATKLLEQVDFGFWQKVYQGSFGRAQFGMEYAYTERHAFAGSNGAPIANDSEVDVSFRYYPF
jgi:multidrug efflux pump subunit AcrA (membrane-fusion protein)